MTLGEKLAELRQKSGLSQDRVAELLGVSRQAVSKWERDEAKPDLDNIVNISNIYNVTTDYLLKEKQEEQKEYKRQETHQSPPASNGSSFFQDMMRFIKEKWYWLGYGLAAWGIIDIITAVVGSIMWNSLTGSIMGYDLEGLQTDVTSSTSLVVDSGQTIDPFVDTVMNASSYVLWLPVLIGLLKVAVGIVVVIYGRRYVRRMKARRY